jgi:NAD(P)-dependent dehydrogenase (short-subunit alcohol dehydrogenase family)
MTMSQIDLDMLRRIVEVRLWGLTYGMRHAAPLTRQGLIIFTSGSLTSRPRSGTAMLTGMRSAVEALTRELAPVRGNTVTPGLIDTPLLHTAYGPERETMVQNWAALLPGKRVGTADKIAQVILMLMTNESVMGEVVHVDGGGRFAQARSSDPVHPDV